MKEMILCGHTGSFNHGCEAIIKGTAELLAAQNIQPVLATKAKSQDEAFGVTEFSSLVEYTPLNGKPIHLFIGRVINKITHPPIGTEYFHGRKVWKRLKGNVALNVGGDTYCYDIPRTSMALNWYTQKKNIPNILWACSIEKSALTEPIMKDLNRYTMIMPRESLTYDYLLQAGIPKKKLTACVDPAFALSPEPVQLDESFFKKKVIGINLSPLVVSEGAEKNIVMDNYCMMIDYIIEKTAYNICFIPHVYDAKTGSQDLVTLKEMQDKYKETKRTLLIEKDYNCRQLKHIISKCDMMVCARTHASIAAYSSAVPTLVMGYSVKSLGIAQDLFGTHEGYVLPAQGLKSDTDLLDAFKVMEKNQVEIKKHLKSELPTYRQKAIDAARVLAEFTKA